MPHAASHFRSLSLAALRSLLFAISSYAAHCVTLLQVVHTRIFSTRTAHHAPRTTQQATSKLALSLRPVLLLRNPFIFTIFVALEFSASETFRHLFILPASVFFVWFAYASVPFDRYRAREAPWPGYFTALNSRRFIFFVCLLASFLFFPRCVFTRSCRITTTPLMSLGVLFVAPVSRYILTIAIFATRHSLFAHACQFA